MTNARKALKSNWIGTGLLALFLSAPVLAKELPRIDFHTECVVSYVLNETGKILRSGSESSAKIVCNGVPMQEGISDFEQIDAWERHLKANHFHETSKSNSLQASPYREWHSTTYQNKKPQPFARSSAALSEDSEELKTGSAE
jgi:hypothetical protein